jgi:hypothetical protein
MSLAMSRTSGFSRARTPDKPKQIQVILSWACALLQSTTKQLAATVVSSVTRPLLRDSSLEVESLTAFPHSGQRPSEPGLPPPPRLRLQVFPTSWRLHPPKSLLALFHARSAHRVRPSKLFPRTQAVPSPTHAALMALATNHEPPRTPRTRRRCRNTAPGRGCTSGKAHGKCPTSGPYSA